MSHFRTTLLFLLAILLPATTTSAQEPETHVECQDIQDIKERLRCKKTEEAEERLIKAALQKLEEKRSSEEELFEEMSKAEKEGDRSYLGRDASSDKMLAGEKQKLGTLFKEQICLYTKDDKCLVDGSPGSELTQQMLTRHSTTLNTFIDDIEKSFTERYDKARDRVLKKQLDDLGSLLSVPPEQIEAFAAEIISFKRKTPLEMKQSLQSPPLSNEVATLEKNMLDEIRKSHAIFEENERGLAGIITAEVENGLRQLQYQLDLVGRHEGGNKRAYSQIRWYIKQDVDSAAQSAKRQDGNPWWFGTVEGPKGAIAERAASLEKERLKDFVGKALDVQKGCAAIPEKKLLDGTPADYTNNADFRSGVPRKLKDHVEKLRQRAIELARERIIDDYVKDQNFTNDDKKSTRGLLARDGDAWYRLYFRVKNCLEELSLKTYRDKLAEQELAAKHRDIADHNFAFQDPYESYYTDHEESAAREEIVKQSVVTRIYEKPEIAAVEALAEGDFPERGDLYLDETVDLFADRKKKLTEEAWTAAHGQMPLVEKLGRDFREQIRKLSHEERGKEGAQQEWENRYIEAVHEAWRRRQENRKYSGLFALTRQTIRSFATQEWQKEPPTPEREATPKTNTDQTSVTEQKKRAEAKPNHAANGSVAGGGGPKDGPGKGTWKGQKGGGGINSVQGAGPGGSVGGKEGGGLSCETQLSTCRQATEKCHQLLVECSSNWFNWFGCQDEIKNCELAKERCRSSK